MAKLENKTKENPKLEQRVMNDGRISLYLEYYIGRESVPVLDEYDNPVLYESGAMKGKPKMRVKHIRRQENLKLYLIAKPRTPEERNDNKDNLALANKIRFEREQQFLKDRKGYRLDRETQIDFIDYFQTYLDNYTKADARMIKIALNRFKDFLHDTPEYNCFESYNKKNNCFESHIKPEQLTRDMMIDFTEYLESRSKGEGAKTIYQRFKKVINHALEHGVMKANPRKGVTIKVDDKVLRKDILSDDEIALLMNARHPKENANISNAFLFCLFTGMRFCDVKDLTFANVDYSNKLLRFEQNKVKGHSASSGVTIPLDDMLMRLIGTPTEAQNKDSLIFPLPSYWMCLKSLQRWVDRAGINKHITWHCARHSFAVGILSDGANVKTVADLLGHSDLKNTEKYLRAVDEQKKRAINTRTAKFVTK
jgi:integrase